jgi:hypothetical protein
MAEQVANTPATEQVQNTPAETPQAQENTEQAQQTAPASVEIEKADPANLTPEQVKELQLGYMRNKDYTTKTQELAQQKKQPVNFTEIVQSPEFLEWAKTIGLVAQNTTKEQQQEPEFLTAFTDEQKQALQYMFSQAIQPLVQQSNAQTIAQQDEKLKDTHKEIFTPELQKKLNSFQAEVLKAKGALYRDEAFKVLDYDEAVKRAFEMGRQEGLKGKQERQQANLPQTSTTTQGVSIYNKNDSPRDKLRKSFEDAEKKHGNYESARPHYLGK